VAQALVILQKYLTAYAVNGQDHNDQGVFYQPFLSVDPDKGRERAPSGSTLKLESKPGHSTASKDGSAQRKQQQRLMLDASQREGLTVLSH